MHRVKQRPEDALAVGLGVWKVKEDEVVSSVKHAIQTGYRSFNTAAIYGNEEGVGQAFKESGVAREDLFITTKVWNILRT